MEYIKNIILLCLSEIEDVSRLGSNLKTNLHAKIGETAITVNNEHRINTILRIVQRSVQVSRRLLDKFRNNDPTTINYLCRGEIATCAKKTWKSFAGFARLALLRPSDEASRRGRGRGVTISYLEDVITSSP